MKKQTNFETLKALVNSTDAERVGLDRVGVQAYNIAEGEEYCVIVAFAKIKGRYYFIDREGRQFLASRYDRVEFVAGDFLDVHARDIECAADMVDELEREGQVIVFSEVFPFFDDEVRRRGLKVSYTSAGRDDDGELLTRFYLIRPTDTNDHNTPTEEDTNEPTAPAAPHASTLDRMATAAANVGAHCAKYAKRAAFALSLVAVFALALSVAVGSMAAVCPLVDALNITGPARFAVSLLIFAGPVAELAVNVEVNALAVVDRLFPGQFWQRLPFEVFSFWGRLLRA